MILVDVQRIVIDPHVRVGEELFLRLERAIDDLNAGDWHWVAWMATRDDLDLVADRSRTAYEHGPHLGISRERIVVVERDLHSVRQIPKM